MSTSEAITVGAALLAASLSGLTLFVTARRDERKWRRESLVGTIVQFMDGSFRLPGNRAYRVLMNGGDLTEIRANATEGLHDCATALTRLRILAPHDLVERAEALHELDETITELLLGPPPLPTVDVWLPLADQRMDARTALLDAARKGLGLGKARRFVPSRHRVQLE